MAVLKSSRYDGFLGLTSYFSLLNVLFDYEDDGRSQGHNCIVISVTFHKVLQSDYDKFIDKYEINGPSMRDNHIPTIQSESFYTDICQYSTCLHTKQVQQSTHQQHEASMRYY